MDCPLLSMSRLKPCRSTKDVFAHTLFLPDKCCKDIWFTLCPLFRQQRSQWGKIFDNDNGRRDDLISI